eukprot:TRINITY_DN73767_c0_g1_i1.p1 TRINITY_DN73767_c0_g1~~TRINITY_DN73767_c0_g1_i1.p1  ORF type:complete len:348 (+),score=34.33 TRINITY_DN73767_c0_g1_i1:58-1044(+)
MAAANDADLEMSISAAAQIIRNADILLIASGAGLSADSGMATFATLTAKMGAALGEGVTYDVAAGFDCFAKNPSLFYGFWFASARNYALAEPHAGYDVLREWRERTEARGAAVSGITPCFVLTSNVDGWLERQCVPVQGGLAQIHGCYTAWQCGGVPSGRKFPLLAKPGCCKDIFGLPEFSDMDFEAVPLRYHGEPPRCPKCNEGWLRPQVYLFGDQGFLNKEEITGEQSFRQWREAVIKTLGDDPKLRLAIVEVGCGLRVPNIQKRCKELLEACPEGQCDLVKINPEEGGLVKPSVLVKAPALHTLLAINREILALDSVASADGKSL